MKQPAHNTPSPDDLAIELSQAGVVSGHEGAAGFRKIITAPFLFLIAVYQRILSPLLHAAAGPTFGCRFHPTCSHYAAEALRTHGVTRGLGLAIWRLLRCTPLSAGGFDPVPVRKVRCERIA